MTSGGMRYPQRFALWMLVGILPVLTILGASCTETYIGATAKEAFTIAAPYARSGASDAELCGIGMKCRGCEVDWTGELSLWRLSFWSPSLNQYIDLLVEEDELFLADGRPAYDVDPSEVWRETTPTRMRPIGQWVDSSVAARAAQSALEERYSRGVCRDLELLEMKLTYDDILDMYIWKLGYCHDRTGHFVKIDPADATYLGTWPGTCVEMPW